MIDFDNKFNAGENVTDPLNLSQAKRHGTKQKRVDVDFPEWMVNAIDKEANDFGAVINKNYKHSGTDLPSNGNLPVVTSQ